MIELERLSIAWAYIKDYAAAVISSGLIYLGLGQVFWQLDSTLTKGMLRFINWIVETQFPDRIRPFTDDAFYPWRLQVMVIAEGIIPIAFGVLLGLWVYRRKHRRQLST